MNFKQSLMLIAAVIVPLMFIVQKSKGRQPNTLASVPIQVMGEGRLTNLAVGTHLITMMGTTNTLSNSFTGYWQTNATWILYTNSGNPTGSVIVTTITANEGLSGTWQPTVSIPEDVNAKTWLLMGRFGSNDICPQATFKTGLRPSVMVMGFNLTVSNWSGSTFRGWDMVRIGQSPYVICQLNDNVSDHPATGIALWVHTPDAPGTGLPVAILDNGEVYHVMVLYDAPNDLGSIKVFQKLSNGRYAYKGQSNLPMTSSTAAENVFFSMHDDHSALAAGSTGGDFRYSHFWMTTNREAFLNSDFPKY